MITYKIVFKSGSKKSAPDSIKPASPHTTENYKEIVFQRALAKCALRVDQYVKIRGTSTKCKIKEIYSDFDRVEWKQNKPFFIVIELPDGSQQLANPGQLHRRKL